MGVSWPAAARSPPECTGPARNCGRRPWPEEDRADSRPRCRASSCRCPRCSRQSGHARQASTVSSGSGTDHFASRRMCTCWPGPATCSRTGLEEKLRALRRVHAIVKIAAAGIFGFGHARAAAAIVSHARGPHALAFDRRQHFRGSNSSAGSARCNQRHQIAREIGMVHDRVPVLQRNAIVASLVFHVAHIRDSAVALCGSVKFHARLLQSCNNLLHIVDAAAPNAAAGLHQRRPQPRIFGQFGMRCKIGTRSCAAPAAARLPRR